MGAGDGATRLDDVAVEDLETRGFVHVPGFLSSEELELLRADAEGASSNGNRNYNLLDVSADAAALVEGRIDEVAERIGERTSIRVDAPAGANYFATGVVGGIDFPWHQDHESYFLFQNHHDYLNFYIPIVKPEVGRSNLSVLPFDVLSREAPKVHRMALHSGARHFLQVLGRSLAVSDETGSIQLMPRRLADLAETPDLAAGDLLILRGDMLHRTQDADTVRVAMSIRRVRRTTPISRTRLVSGGLRKALMMSNFPLPYQHVFAIFDAAGREVMTYDEMVQLAPTIELPEAIGRKAFLRQLLAEKYRARRLPSLVLDVPRAVALRGFIEVQGRMRARRARSGH